MSVHAEPMWLRTCFKGQWGQKVGYALSIAQKEIGGKCLCMIGALLFLIDKKSMVPTERFEISYSY